MTWNPHPEGQGKGDSADAWPPPEHRRRPPSERRRRPPSERLRIRHPHVAVMRDSACATSATAPGHSAAAANGVRDSPATSMAASVANKASASSWRTCVCSCLVSRQMSASGRHMHSNHTFTIMLGVPCALSAPAAATRCRLSNRSKRGNCNERQRRPHPSCAGTASRHNSVARRPSHAAARRVACMPLRSDNELKNWRRHPRWAASCVASCNAGSVLPVFPTTGGGR